MILSARCGFLVNVIALLTVATSFPATAASKNKQGNRLFELGRYVEAEKAYIEAGMETPARPEVLYNLGNTLVKQKKSDQAIQSLQQAISKGDRTLQANSWFNIGDALFDDAKYQEAVQAFIQALRINPGDRDAKHNLELALRKLQQQQNSPQSSNAGGQHPKDQSKQGAQSNQDTTQEQGDSQAQRPNSKNDHPQSARPERVPGTFTRERALQILDALQNQEAAEQRKRGEHQERRKARGKDW